MCQYIAVILKRISYKWQTIWRNLIKFIFVSNFYKLMTKIFNTVFVGRFIKNTYVYWLKFKHQNQFN